MAYFPGFLASAMAVLIEKPSRRSSLAFYVSNVASETLFRICVGRGYFRPLRNGQVYLFTLSMATLMMLAKKNGFEDDPLSAAIKLIVGPDEAHKRLKRNQTLVNNELEQCKEVLLKPSTNEVSASQRKLVKRLSKTTNLDSLLDWIRDICLGGSDPSMKLKHSTCPHVDCSCLYYVTKSSLRALLIGYVAQFGLRLSSRIHLAIKDPMVTLRAMAFDTGILNFGLFLASFTALFKGTSCCLRWTTQQSGPLNCFLAGLVAGPSLLFYPSPTVALYVLWKCLEALFNDAVANGMIKNKNFYIVLLYGFATSQLFYSALMDPQYMKKSYMAFLDRISHHRLHMVNRSVLDVFGTEASTGYEDFFPDLHPKFMSRAFLGSVWIWMIEQKFVANQLTV